MAHNTESIMCFLDYYKSLNISGESTLCLALYLKKRIQDIVPQLEHVFQHIICTQTKGHSPMPANILGAHFTPEHSTEIIKDSTVAIRKGLEGLKEDSGMAIIGTHCLGPSINEIFKISFDSL